MIARVLNVLVGLGLTGLALYGEPAGNGVRGLDAVLGIVVAAVALVAIVVPWARFANTAVGLWLFLSGVPFRGMLHAYLTVVFGLLVVVLSLVPTSDRTFWPPFRRERLPARGGTG